MITDRPPLLVVSGLRAEARIAAGPGVVCVAAPPSALLRKLAEMRVEPSAVLSFGLCGGLAPELPVGTLVVSASVLYRDKTWTCDRALSSRLMSLAADIRSKVVEGSMACADAPVLTASEKAALQAGTGAVAVDTESHVAARFAAHRGLPFVVLRAVCDTAAKDLPPLAVRAIGPDGLLNWKTIASEIAGRPQQLLHLPGTALATARAMRSLRRVRRRLGPRFGL